MEADVGRYPVTISEDSPCKIWTGPVHSNGYGRCRVYIDGERYAHRAAYIKAYGPIPKGMDVCHKCDVKLCVNPAHLELGSRSKNVKDQWERGVAVRGSATPMTNLIDNDIREIRQRYAEGELQKDLAEEFGVGQKAISKIVLRQRWRHIQ